MLKNAVLMRNVNTFYLFAIVYVKEIDSQIPVIQNSTYSISLISSILYIVNDLLTLPLGK